MLDRILRQTAQAIEIACAALFIGVLGFTSLNIVLRNVLGVSWLFVDGLLRLMFIWMVFLGTAALYYRNDHLVMDFFQGKMSERMRSAVVLVGDILFLLVTLALIVYGIQVVDVRMGIPFETWDVPTGYAYLAVPVCAFVMAVFCLNNMLSRKGK